MIGPARFTGPWAMTFWTPGCSVSVVRKTCLHSCSLSIVYFSVTFMVPMMDSVSLSHRATSSPMEMEFARSSSADSVMGMGQKRPSLEGIWKSSQQPFQSS